MTNSNEEPIIHGQKVCKIYNTGRVEVVALQDVDIAVVEGEMVAVMGPSGSGKTTLLNCLSGLDDIDSGMVSIRGTDLTQMSDNQKTHYRATKMGYIFQSYNLLPVLTAEENVELPLLVSGTKAKAAREKAIATLEMVNLVDRRDHYPSELSGGQQQRVTIARALVNQPEIIWADEPTGNLDSTNTEEIMDLLCEFNEKNRQTFILVTHADEVAARAHRIIRIVDGRITTDGRSFSSASEVA